MSVWLYTTFSIPCEEHSDVELMDNETLMSSEKYYFEAFVTFVYSPHGCKFL